MTYEYQDLATGEVFEVEQKITEPAFTHRESTGTFRTLSEDFRGAHAVSQDYSRPCSDEPPLIRLRPVKRLISRGAPFQLKSGPAGGWGSSGYSKPEHERKAEAVLGHPVRKAL